VLLLIPPGFYLRRSGDLRPAQVRLEGKVPHFLLQRLKVRQHRQDRKLRAAQNQTLRVLG
jgi:hypothetical protein